MRRALVLALLLAAFPAGARELRLNVGETLTVPYPGATAAFSVEPAVVEASAGSGRLVLVGRQAGRGQVTVVTPAATETLLVWVVAPPAPARSKPASSRKGRGGTWEGRYDSATRRLTTSLSYEAEDGARAARLRLLGLREEEHSRGRTLHAFPSASLELTAPGRSLVLLDELVEASPLTLDGVVLRGLHLRRSGFTLHGGLTSATPWEDVLFSRDGERALALSHRAGRGAVHWTPTLLWLPDASASVPGVISLGLERGKAGDFFRGVVEAGWSRVPGGALDLELSGRRQHAWLEARHRPEGFAAPETARPPGTFLDGAWSADLGGRVSSALTVSASRLDLLGERQRAASESLELRYRPFDRWTLSAAGAAGSYEGRDRRGKPLRRLTGSLGASYDRPSLGITGQIRQQQISGSSGRAPGGRLMVRAGFGSFRGHLFVDSQRDAPTLELLFQNHPGLDRALAKLGLTVESPEELVRLLRDQGPLLAEHGVRLGELRLDPWRLNGGFELSWRGRSERRPEGGFRLIANETRGDGRDRSAYLATLYASGRLFGGTDLVLGYSRWTASAEGKDEESRGSVEVALRSRIPELSGWTGGRRAIRGFIWRDDQATGDPLEGGRPLGGVGVILDGLRRTQSDSSGRFVFEEIASGAHRVEVVLPPGAYFTTPSVVSLEAGGEAVFGIAYSVARLAGRVRNDAGLPMPGVTVRLEGGLETTAITDSGGVFRFAAAGGEARLSLVADSLPPGYDLAALGRETVRLRVGAPASRDLVVKALRSLSGTVRATRPAEVTVTVEELGLTVTPAADGRFVLRGLPAGRLTLVARAGGRMDQQVVELPPEPATLDVVLNPGTPTGTPCQAGCRSGSGARPRGS